jgi:hypothetical protein
MNVCIVICSIAIFFNTKKAAIFFHFFNGLAGIYSSNIFFLYFIYKVNYLKTIGMLEIVLYVLLYFLLVLITNYYILKSNFTKYPQSSFKFTPFILLIIIIARIIYAFIINITKIDGLATSSFVLSIAFGCMIHSFEEALMVVIYAIFVISALVYYE